MCPTPERHPQACIKQAILTLNVSPAPFSTGNVGISREMVSLYIQTPKCFPLPGPRPLL